MTRYFIGNKEVSKEDLRKYALDYDPRTKRFSNPHKKDDEEVKECTYQSLSVASW